MRKLSRNKKDINKLNNVVAGCNCNTVFCPPHHDGNKVYWFMIQRDNAFSGHSPFSRRSLI